MSPDVGEADEVAALLDTPPSGCELYTPEAALVVDATESDVGGGCIEVRTVGMPEDPYWMLESVGRIVAKEGDFEPAEQVRTATVTTNAVERMLSTKVHRWREWVDLRDCAFTNGDSHTATKTHRSLIMSTRPIRVLKF